MGSHSATQHSITQRIRGARRSRAVVGVIALVAGLAVPAGLADVTARAATTETTIYASDVVPATPATNDPNAVELGVRFQVRVAGSITGVRYYKSAQNTGTHVGSLWSSSGTLLARVTFSNETSQGWQSARFSQSVAVAPNTTYTASYHTNSGYYSSASGVFSSGKTLGTGDVVASAGTYRYSAPTVYPTSTWQSSAYYVDVTFARATTAAAATPTTLTTPPSAGVPSGTTLTAYTGPTTISVDNTVIDRKDIPVALTITAKNVTISNSRVHASADSKWGIYVKGGSATITATTVTTSLNAIIGTNYTANRVEVTALGEDGFKLGSNVRIDHSWCHDLATVSGAHADCAQMEGGETQVAITYSWFDNADNSAIILKPDFGPSTDGPVLVDHNVLGGGNYSFYSVPGPNGPYYVRNITVSNNKFLRDYRYGPADVTMPVTASNNTWFDNGAAVTF